MIRVLFFWNREARGIGVRGPAPITLCKHEIESFLNFSTEIIETPRVVVV
jgi:hypothetical protein